MKINKTIIYSRKFNKYNWFEIYSNQESSEKQAQNHHGTYVPCSNTNENFELSEYIKFSNSLAINQESTIIICHIGYIGKISNIFF